jgi:hypothetical protein
VTVRLCQRAKASCGACCGVYNRADPDRAAVHAELARHTRVLARAPRTPEGFREAAARLAPDAPAPLIPTIRVCQLAGFLDAAETRVGCLAHPRVTGGVDLRACGVYDVDTCESFLCPSHATITEAEAAILEGATDFHLYGLTVTDAPFVRAVLDAVAAGGGAPVEPRHLRHAPFAAALRRLLAVKEELAAGSDGLFGAFRHRGAGEARPRPEEPPGAEQILEALGADARSGNDEELLGEELRLRLVPCAATFRAALAAVK